MLSRASGSTARQTERGVGSANGQTEEAAAVFRFLAELSPDIYVMAMSWASTGRNTRSARWPAMAAPEHAAIHRTPDRREMHDAFAAAPAAGLWRFDQRADRISLAVR